MAKASLGYKYKPKASNLFQPARVVNKQQDTLKSLQTQERNLTQRFGQVFQPVPQQTDGQLGLLAELTGEKPKTEVDNRNLLEKALNLKADQNVLMDILEVMDRPRQVVSNVLSSLGNEDDRNILQAAWEGLAGRKRISTKEALQKMVGNDEFLEIAESDGILDEVGNFVIDLGLDMLSDPTTYTGLGFITKPLGGAAKWAGRSLVELGEAGLKSTNKWAQAFGGAVDLVKKSGVNLKFAFNAKEGLPEWFIKKLDQISPGIGEKARKWKLTLAETKKLIDKGGPEADKVVYELFESNSRITKVNGQLVITTPNTTLTVRELLQSMAETGKTLRGGKKLSYLLPNLTRQTNRTTSQLQKIIKKLNKEAGGEFFRLKRGKILADRFENSIEFIGDKNMFQEFFFGNPSRGAKGILESGNKKFLGAQVSFLGADLNTDAVKEVIQKLGGSEATTKILATMQDLTRKSRELISDMGKYKIGPDVLGPGGQGLRYARRVITKEGKDFLGSLKPVANIKYTRPGRELLAGRTFSNTLLASEINKAAKAIYGVNNNIFNESAIASLDELVNVALEKYTQREATELVLGVKLAKNDKGRFIVQEQQSANLFMPVSENTVRAAAAEVPENFRILQKGQIKQEFSRLYNNLPDEMKAVWDKMLEKAGAAGETIAMQKSAYGVLSNLNRAYEEVPQFLKFYDKVMAKWKTLNLLSPAFNIRNFWGNSANMYLSGMSLNSQLRYTTEAFFDLKKYDDLLRKSALDPSNIKGTLTPDELKFVDEVGQFFREGISQSYANTRDLDGVLEAIKKGKPKKKGVAKIFNDYAETNFRVAENIDNTQRYAMWKYHKARLGKVNPGGIDNSFKAAQEVRNALFDYTNLTKFEKDYMKRLVPFYTFMKNNLIFQMKNITKMPNQYKKMLRSYKYWGENIADLKEEDIPEYMSGNMWLPIPLVVGANEQDKIMWLKTNLPLADFTEFVENPLKKGLTGVTVPIKLLWELGSGKELFTGGAIKGFEGQQNRMEDPDNQIFLNEIRGKNGEIYLSGDPVIQKIADELGLRTPRRLASSILDVLDTATGAQTTDNLIEDILSRSGVTDTKTVSELELSALYQRVEKLRNLKKLYEQNVGELPGVRRQTGLPSSNLPKPNVRDRAGYLYRPK